MENTMDKYDDQAMALVTAQASVKSMTTSEIMQMKKEIAASLRIEAGEASLEMEDGPAIVCDPKTAITETYIKCCVCGQRMKILTSKHLATHGLTPEQYKEKFGYKKTQPLACRSLARERRKKMKEMKLWERRGKKEATNIPAEKSKSGKPATKEVTA